MFPVRYGLDFYILFRRNSVFKGLIVPKTVVFRKKGGSKMRVSSFCSSFVRNVCLANKYLASFARDRHACLHKKVCYVTYKLEFIKKKLGRPTFPSLSDFIRIHWAVPKLFLAYRDGSTDWAWLVSVPRGCQCANETVSWRQPLYRHYSKYAVPET
jgi:hypothetical protein